MNTNQPGCALHPGASAVGPGTLMVDEALKGGPSGESVSVMSTASPLGETTTRQTPSGEVVVVPSVVMKSG